VEGEKRNSISAGGLGWKSEVLACLQRSQTYHGFDPMAYIWILLSYIYICFLFYPIRFWEVRRE